jgi:hypothetical protein
MMLWFGVAVAGAALVEHWLSMLFLFLLSLLVRQYLIHLCVAPMVSPFSETIASWVHQLRAWMRTLLSAVLRSLIAALCLDAHSA